MHIYGHFTYHTSAYLMIEVSVPKHKLKSRGVFFFLLIQPRPHPLFPVQTEQMLSRDVRCWWEQWWMTLSHWVALLNQQDGPVAWNSEWNGITTPCIYGACSWWRTAIELTKCMVITNIPNKNTIISEVQMAECNSYVVPSKNNKWTEYTTDL